MDDRSILFGLHEIDGIGWKSIQNIVNRVPTLQHILTMSAAQISQLGLSLSKAERISRQLMPSYVTQRRNAYNDAGVKIITYYDENYPPWLRETASPPWVLYCIGNSDLLKNWMIAVVGTRNPTTYGKKVARDLSAQLANRGFSVVSGLARGIDSESHKGALEGEAATIAVLGCGIDVIYPPENAGLYKVIAAKGLIVSEYPLGTRPAAGLFPLRNRIISGVSLGTVVVEAAEGSGSLITARLALDASRDLFAVPGQISSPNSRGTLSLLKEGAKLVTCVEDIIEEYQHLVAAAPLPNQVESVQEEVLNAEEQHVIDFLSLDPVNIDELVVKTKYEFGHLYSVLLSLQLKNRIEQLPGSAFVIN